MSFAVKKRWAHSIYAETESVSRLNASSWPNFAAIVHDPQSSPSIVISFEVFNYQLNMEICRYTFISNDHVMNMLIGYRL